MISIEILIAPVLQARMHQINSRLEYRYRQACAGLFGGRRWRAAAAIAAGTLPASRAASAAARIGSPTKLTSAATATSRRARSFYWQSRAEEAARNSPPTAPAPVQARNSRTHWLPASVYPLPEALDILHGLAGNYGTDLLFESFDLVVAVDP